MDMLNGANEMLNFGDESDPSECKKPMSELKEYVLSTDPMLKNIAY